MKKTYFNDFDRDVLARDVLTNCSVTNLKLVEEIIKDFPQLSISLEAYDSAGNLLTHCFAVVVTGLRVDFTAFWDRFLHGYRINSTIS